ncbi:hypothetical protein, partial [Pseudomonas sp. PS02285]|uniref:hypothetical protein n=1 Tax=Pseudomonas sp. PS02285 TaxID=2991441 RepID=UPI00249C5C36
LACDSITSVQLNDRGASIAGKPAPTFFVYVCFDLIILFQPEIEQAPTQVPGPVMTTSVWSVA